MKIVYRTMGMPAVVEIIDERLTTKDDITKVFKLWEEIDERFSPYKANSEVTKLNDGRLSDQAISPKMEEIIKLSKQTEEETGGYFNVGEFGRFDPSGLVKGWAIAEAAHLLEEFDYQDFYVEIAGDIQVSGKNLNGQPWRVGIRNPFDSKQIIKVLRLSNQGIATSGTAKRGNHIYNPHNREELLMELVSMTVVASSVFNADRLATAAFAMGKRGIKFLAELVNVEGYSIDQQGIATMTDGFERLATA